MKRLSFTVQLLSDVTVTRDAATEGAHTALDYLPGSLFLGWAAAQKYAAWKNAGNRLAWDVFHSGKVRFCAATLRGALPAPFAWHFRKGGSATANGLLDTAALANLAVEEWDAWEQRTRTADEARQPVQMRAGWFLPDTSASITPEQRLRLKTAMDRDKFGTAKEGQLFGYSTLVEGQTFIGCVEMEDSIAPAAVQEMEQLFAAERELRLGRSRGAEYGAARIVQADMANAPATPAIIPPGGVVVLYAATDLCLSDELGQPTFDLSRALTGTPLAGAVALPARTHVRTRRFTAWNAWHGSHGPFRLLVEKGSTFALQVPAGAGLSEEMWIGSYQNEGCGRLLVSPDFLQPGWKPGLLPSAPYSPPPPGASLAGAPLDWPFAGLVLGRWREAALTALVESEGLRLAQAWHRWLITRSQWGRVREISAAHSSRTALGDALREMFSHGRAMRYWQDKSDSDNARSRWPGNRVLDFLGVARIPRQQGANPPPVPPAAGHLTALAAEHLDPAQDLDAFLCRTLHHAAMLVPRLMAQRSDDA